MKGTKITLNGVEKVLRYDLNAIGEIGDILDIKVRLSHITEDLLEKPMPLSSITVILWGGLIHAEPELTRKEVGSWVDLDNAAEVMQGFFGLFSETSPEIQEQVRENLGLEQEKELKLKTS